MTPGRPGRCTTTCAHMHGGSAPPGYPHARRQQPRIVLAPPIYPKPESGHGAPFSVHIFCARPSPPLPFTHPATAHTAISRNPLQHGSPCLCVREERSRLVPRCLGGSRGRGRRRCCRQWRQWRQQLQRSAVWVWLGKCVACMCWHTTRMRRGATGSQQADPVGPAAGWSLKGVCSRGSHAAISNDCLASRHSCRSWLAVCSARACWGREESAVHLSVSKPAKREDTTQQPPNSQPPNLCKLR